ncbi:hypothetical protein U6G28_08925 [Actinomycetaceae bacterium MB13-C1-2]|nr:hypothetical protein U6G28_08925 [Actinomycetaceae bacterium MB13-C1-2]
MTSIPLRNTELRETAEMDMKSVPLNERETTINIPGDGSEVMIWTNIPRDIRAFRSKAPKVSELKSGFQGTTEWAEFRVAYKDFNPAKGVRNTRQLTEEQRQAVADRFRAFRENQTEAA